MYSRSKKQRDFDQCSVYLYCSILGLPSNWISLLMFALYEGGDDLVNFTAHCHGNFKKQLLQLLGTGSPIQVLGRLKKMRITALVVDGACLRGASGHTPGKRWHLPVPFSSTERDFLLVRKPDGSGKLAGVAPVTHDGKISLSLSLSLSPHTHTHTNTHTYQHPYPSTRARAHTHTHTHTHSSTLPLCSHTHTHSTCSHSVLFVFASHRTIL